MFKRADTRFASTSAAAAAGKTLVLPLVVLARQPTAKQALAAARLVVEAFAKLVETAETPGGHLALIDPSSGAAGARSGSLSIEQRSAKEAQVAVEFVAALTIDGPSGFWPHAQVIAWATDVVQGFGTQTWPKGVWLVPKRGRDPTDAVDGDDEPLGDMPE